MTTAKKTKKLVQDAILYVVSSFNNTILTLTDQAGGVIAWASSGTAGFKGTRKGTPFAAQQAANQLVVKAKKLGVKQVDIKLKGPGQGKEPTVRAFYAGGIRVVTVEDITPIPHNGCRPSRRRKI